MYVGGDYRIWLVLIVRSDEEGGRRREDGGRKEKVGEEEERKKRRVLEASVPQRQGFLCLHLFGFQV